MIADNFAGPLSRIATKSFSCMSNPDKPTIQRIFVDNWNEFLKDHKVITSGLRPLVSYEVDKVMKCETLDERLRDFFKRDRDLLTILFFAAKDTLTYVVDNMNGKNRTFKPGFILTLHTFGSPLNWNSHIHCLVIEGGMDEKDNYEHIKYISFESLRRSFMKQVLDYLKDNYDVNHPNELRNLKELIDTITGFPVFKIP